jgi:perosamine synthetase
MEIRDDVIPVLKPRGGKEEINAIAEVIESGWWGKGPKVEEFEKKFAELVGAKYAVGVTSASAAIDILMKALNINNCDVINPTISFISTAVIPLWNDCSSNIVDIGRKTLTINPEDVKKNLKPNTRLVIAVNMAGVPADIDAIRKFYDGIIIEDCAHSCYTPGAGTKGDVAVWSFQVVKTMPCGEGGMITTNDKGLHEKLSELIWFGVPSTYSRVSKPDNPTAKLGYTWDYEVDIVGYKCSMIDILAAICLEQMKKLPKHLRLRRHIQKRYNKELRDYIETPAWSETVQYYCARVPKEDRDRLINYLGSKNIHTSVHFKPLHKHPALKQDREFPVADEEWLKLISLPCHPSMTDEDIDYVIYWVKKFFEGA